MGGSPGWDTPDPIPAFVPVTGQIPGLGPNSHQTAEGQRVRLPLIKETVCVCVCVCVSGDSEQSRLHIEAATRVKRLPVEASQPAYRASFPQPAVQRSHKRVVFIH